MDRYKIALDSSQDKKPDRKPRYFLHNHLGLEEKLNLDNDHVIIDKEDWEKAKSKKLDNSSAAPLKNIDQRFSSSHSEDYIESRGPSSQVFSILCPSGYRLIIPLRYLRYRVNSVSMGKEFILTLSSNIADSLAKGLQNNGQV